MIVAPKMLGVKLFHIAGNVTSDARAGATIKQGVISIFVVNRLTAGVFGNVPCQLVFLL